jgi:hypothetical protein
MAAAHEEDVVIAFRQAVEEEMAKMQGEGPVYARQVFPDGAPPEEAIKALAARQLDLEREVALLRTIVLRLVSDPID